VVRRERGAVAVRVAFAGLVPVAAFWPRVEVRAAARRPRPGAADGPAVSGAAADDGTGASTGAAAGWPISGVMPAAGAGEPVMAGADCATGAKARSSAPRSMTGRV